MRDAIPYLKTTLVCVTSLKNLFDGGALSWIQNEPDGLRMWVRIEQCIWNLTLLTAEMCLEPFANHMAVNTAFDRVTFVVELAIVTGSQRGDLFGGCKQRFIRLFAN